MKLWLRRLHFLVELRLVVVVHLVDLACLVHGSPAAVAKFAPEGHAALALLARALVKHLVVNDDISHLLGKKSPF